MAVLAFLVVEHEHEGRDCKEVQQVDSDGQTHDERYEHYPSVGIRAVCLFVPFGHGPEYERGHER